MSHAKGFTLVETMVSISLAAIVLALAAPDLSRIMETNRIAATTNSLITSLNLARSEAITRGVSVAVCKASAHPDPAISGKYLVDDPPVCDISVWNNGDHCWERGWVVFSDQNGNGVIDDNGDTILCEGGEDCVIRVYEALPSGISVRANNNIIKKVRFKNDGSVAGTNGTFSICFNKAENNYRQLIVSPAGRTRTRKCNSVSADWPNCTPCSNP